MIERNENIGVPMVFQQDGKAPRDVTGSITVYGRTGYLAVYCDGVTIAVPVNAVWMCLIGSEEAICARNRRAYEE